MADKDSISIIEAGPKASLIEQLEALLEDAKSGELQGIAYVCSWRRNEVGHGWYITENRMRVIGELEQIKWHLLSQDE